MKRKLQGLKGVVTEPGCEMALSLAERSLSLVYSRHSLIGPLALHFKPAVAGWRRVTDPSSTIKVASRSQNLQKMG